MSNEYTEITEVSKTIMRDMKDEHLSGYTRVLHSSILTSELVEIKAKAAAFDLLSKYLHQNEIAVLEIKCTGDGGHSCGETWMEISIGSGCERDGAGDDLIEAVNNAMGVSDD